MLDGVGSCMYSEEGVLWRHMQSFLVVCSQKATEGLGTRCVRVNEQGEGEEWIRRELMFGDGQLLYHWAPFHWGAWPLSCYGKCVCVFVCVCERERERESFIRELVHMCL